MYLNFFKPVNQLPQILLILISLLDVFLWEFSWAPYLPFWELEHPPFSFYSHFWRMSCLYSLLITLIVSLLLHFFLNLLKFGSCPYYSHVVKLLMTSYLPVLILWETLQNLTLWTNPLLKLSVLLFTMPFSPECPPTSQTMLWYSIF